MSVFLVVKITLEFYNIVLILYYIIFTH